MVSVSSNPSNSAVDSLTLNTSGAAASTTSTDSTNSFSDQLLSALESFLNQSGNGSQIQLTIQQEPGQNSGGSQYLVTLSNPAANSNPGATTAAGSSTGASAAASTSAAASSGDAAKTAPAASATAGVNQGDASGMPVVPLQAQIQSMEESWSALTPAQTAFQLANAAGTGGGAPTAIVPGTTMTFGELNQTQQLAYQYGVDFGTNGMSMQNFLEANAGPDTSWNLSYNQIQANPQIQAAASPAYTQTAANTVPAPSLPPNEYATPPATSGNADNLPNPALIQYLPADQQAAAWAALAAAGVYGGGSVS